MIKLMFYEKPHSCDMGHDADDKVFVIPTERQ
jgi:hypothetical protein